MSVLCKRSGLDQRKGFRNAFKVPKPLKRTAQERIRGEREIRQRERQR